MCIVFLALLSYVVVFSGLLLVPYGLMYPARTVRIAHFYANMYLPLHAKCKGSVCPGGECP